jgi:hypothetical protein
MYLAVPSFLGTGLTVMWMVRWATLFFQRWKRIPSCSFIVATFLKRRSSWCRYARCG